MLFFFNKFNKRQQAFLVWRIGIPFIKNNKVRIVGNKNQEAILFNNFAREYPRFFLISSREGQLIINYAFRDAIYVFQTARMEGIPLDIQRIIISYVIFISAYEDRRDRPLRLVCKTWYKLLKENLTWKMTESFMKFKYSPLKDIYFCWREYEIIDMRNCTKIVLDKNGKEVLQASYFLRTTNYLLAFIGGGHYKLYYKYISDKICLDFRLNGTSPQFEIIETSIGLIYRKSIRGKFHVVLYNDKTMKLIAHYKLPESSRVESPENIGYRGVYLDVFYRWSDKKSFPIPMYDEDAELEVYTTGTDIDLLFLNNNVIAYDTVIPKVLWIHKASCYLFCVKNLVVFSDQIVDLYTGRTIPYKAPIYDIKIIQDEYTFYLKEHRAKSPTPDILLPEISLPRFSDLGIFPRTPTQKKIP